MASRLSRFKSKLRLADLAAGMGLKQMDAYVDSDSGLLDRTYSRFLNTFYPIPARQKCNSPVCHRVSSIFDPLYAHKQLNQATHDTLHEIFGHSNIAALRQLSLMARTGHVINAEGNDVYLANAGKMSFQMSFIHGSENLSVFPESTERTIAFLSDRNGEDYYRRHLISGYGHLDCIIGKNADRDVYPHTLAGLETED